MTIIQTLRATVAAAALVLLPSVAVRAQSPVFSSDAEAGRALSQALNTLSSDPQNVRALIEAGNAALALDDTNGALGFFARAEEVDPRNGRIKTGLARAMLMTEKPREALKLFNDAVGLGIPEAEIAGDRGLAYDLRGDTRRAQRDYQAALRRGGDAEVTRRLALSYAISGEREQAMQTLDPLLRIQDRAAWRARAFIMAIGGDVEGANGVARTVMPANLAVPMGPFFARLPSLSASQKAAAVHFGRIPSDGKVRQVLAEADIETRLPQPSTRGAVPMSEPMDSGHEADDEDEPAVAPSVPVSREPRRRPGTPVALAARTDPPKPAPAASASVPSRAPTPAATRAVVPAARSASGLAPAVPVTRDTSPAPGFSQPLTAPARPDEAVRPAQSLPSQSVAVTAAPRTESAPAAIVPAPAAQQSSPPTPLERSLASIVQGLELEQAEAVPLPEPAARKPAVTVAARDADAALADSRAVADKKAADRKAADKKAADKKEAEKKAAEKKAAAKPDPKKLHPERIWAQIATGASKGALVTDYGKLVKKSPAAFKGMTGWTVPFRATRRLLVGPFPSVGRAEDFLKKAGITGFAWSSPAGTEIEKLGGR